MNKKCKCFATFNLIKFKSDLKKYMVIGECPCNGSPQGGREVFM